jgi:pilus assembly protein CpaB
MLQLSYRTRNLIIAAALGIFAVALMLIYTANSESKKHNSATPKNVTVFVATRDIAIGTSGAKLAGGGWMALRTLPSDSVADGAITKPAQLARLVAIQPTYSGEQIVTRRFGTTQQEGLLSDLRGQVRVIELSGDSHQLLAGTLKQGNHVDVVGNIKVPENGSIHYTAVVLRNLLVVKAPADAAHSDVTGESSLSVELQLTQSQAQRIYWLEKNGDWSLLLRPSNGARDAKIQPSSAAGVLEAVNGR